MKETYNKINNTTHNRIFSEEEKNIFTEKAYGSLLSLLHNKSIDQYIFEVIIRISTSYYDLFNEKISDKMLKKIIDKIIFSSDKHINIIEVLKDY